MTLAQPIDDSTGGALQAQLCACSLRLWQQGICLCAPKQGHLWLKTSCKLRTAFKLKIKPPPPPSGTGLSHQQGCSPVSLPKHCQCTRQCGANMYPFTRTCG